MVRTELLTPELKFLEIPKQKWTGIIEATNCASVEELARFSTSSQNSIFDSDDPKLSYASHENLPQDPKDSDDLRALQIRWKRINGDRGLQNGSPDNNGDRRPPPCSMRCQHYLDAVFVGKPVVFLSYLCAYLCLHPLYFCPNPCAYVCLYVSVYVCECVCVTPRLRSWCARETRTVARPIPQAEYLPFVNEVIKARCVCVCVCV